MKFSLCILVILSSLIVSAKTIVNRGVGQVGDHFLTSREVQISQAMESVLFQNQRVELDISSAQFSQSVTATLIEWVVSNEAENFSIAEVNLEDLQNRLQEFEKQINLNGGWKYWKSLEVKSDEIKTTLQRKLRSKNFLQFKTQSSGVAITDSEARDYYNRNRLKFGNLPFESFRENIKTFLAKQILEERIRDWFESLKAKYRVRNFEAERVRQ